MTLCVRVITLKSHATVCGCINRGSCASPRCLTRQRLRLHFCAVAYVCVHMCVCICVWVRVWGGQVRPGLIEADPLECALLVHYDIEEVIDGEKQTKSSVKKIKLSSLSLDSDVAMVAQDVVDKCKLLSSSKLLLVMEVIQQIVQRAHAGMRNEEDEVEWEANWQQAKRSEVDRFMGQEHQLFDSAGQSISLDDLDSYLEMLYEDDMEHKIRGTFLILQLVRDPDNLELLIQKEQFLGLLTRLFREEVPLPPPPHPRILAPQPTPLSHTSFPACVCLCLGLRVHICLYVRPSLCWCLFSHAKADTRRHTVCMCVCVRGGCRQTNRWI